MRSSWPYHLSFWVGKMVHHRNMFPQFQKPVFQTIFLSCHAVNGVILTFLYSLYGNWDISTLKKGGCVYIPAALKVIIAVYLAAQAVKHASDSPDSRSLRSC
jgi:hypothetical protein